MKKIIFITFLIAMFITAAFSEQAYGGENMANYREDIVNIELSTGLIHRNFMNKSIGEGDKKADRFGVRAYRNGVPENLSGTVSGLFVRADGVTVTVTDGYVSGNLAYVTLPDTCYAVEGYFTLAIKATTANDVTTLRIVDGMVSRTSTDANVDPGTVLPSIRQLQAEIDGLLATIPSDFSEIVYSVGGIDQYAVDLIKSVPWERGTIVDGVPAANNLRIRSAFIDISDVDSIVFNVKTGYRYFYSLYDSQKNFISESAWKTAGLTMQKDISCAFIRIVIASTSDITAEVQFVEQASAKANLHVRSGINETKSEFYNINDIPLSAWSIGYVYDGGGVDITGQPNYVCTVATQRIPFDVFVFPDNGYQVMVRYYNDTTAPVWTVTFTTGAIFVPANTPFIVNMSKTSPEAVSNLDEYISHVHVMRADVSKVIPPVRKNTLKMAVLGDSISTYTGYSENDPSLQGAYYPSGNVTNVNFTWWKIIGDYLHASDISVSAISRSAFYDYNESAYPPLYDDDRITRLGANGAPDIVFVMGGTNDGFVSQSADITYEYDINAIEALANSTMKGIALTIRKIQTRYPNARIVMLIPKAVKLSSMQTGYNNERVCKIADYIAKLSEEYGVYKVIDLRKCGINQSNVASFMSDGSIHPNANGMRYIAQYIISCLNE